MSSAKNKERLDNAINDISLGINLVERELIP